MANIVNKTTTAGLLSGQAQMFYDRQLLENVAPKLVHYEYGQKRTLPKNSGKTIQFRKWTPFEAATAALTEGVTPEGRSLSMTEVSVAIQQYGDYVTVTDLLDLTHLDPVISDAVRQMGDQCALTVDTLTREALHIGTNVLYAQGKTSRAALAQSDILTSELVRKAVRTLKKNKAKKFCRKGNRGYYVAIVGPETVYDLQSDEDWKAVATYQNAEQIYEGEIGKFYGVVFVETSEAKIFKGAGGGGVDIGSTLVFGADAYGVIDLGGAGENVKTIVKPAGSAGTADPLNQLSTVGWKVSGYAAKILQDGWLMRIEHGLSA